MSYRYIFLDLDDTLLDFTKSQAAAFEAICHMYNIPYSDELLQSFIQYNLSLWEQLEQQQIDKETLLATRFPTFFAPYQIDMDGKEADEQFRSQLANHAFLVEGAQHLLIELKKRGKHLYAASNGVYNTQLKRLNNTQLIGFFEQLFISEKLKANKPDPAFFERSIAQLDINFNIKEALMVGDSISSDVKGALNYGMDVCWFNPRLLTVPENLSPTYTIQSLQQLLDIV